MFKYIKYTKVETDNTVLEFRGGDEVVKVNHFDVDVVSVEAENSDAIDALVATQADEIHFEEIEKDEFKTLVTDSAQLNRIREVVASKVAERYTIADEIAMSKRAVDDVKRVTYEDYVKECVAIGNALKDEIGY